VDAIPTYLATSRQNHGLETLFEGLEDRPFPNLEALKRAIRQLIKGARNLAANELSQVLIDALKIPEFEKCEAVVLERISGKAFYSWKTEDGESMVVLDLRLEIPRQLRTKRGMKAIYPPEHGPVLFCNWYLGDQQNRIMTARNGPLAKAAKRQMESQCGIRTLQFRFGPHGVEFRAPRTNIMSKAAPKS
jgi:hypothetical protein